LKEAEADMIEWLDLIGAALGHKRFVKTADIVKEFLEAEPATRDESTEPPTTFSGAPRAFEQGFVGIDPMCPQR
jgi:hypothetical protein